MWFLPYEGVTFESPLTVDEVRAKLEAVVQPRKMWRWPFSRKHKPYEGWIKGDRFRVKRIIHYGNSFLPVIKGEFGPRLSGSSVRLVMHPLPSVIALGAAMFGAFGLAAVFALAEIIREFSGLGSLELAYFTPIGLCAFVYAMFMVGFKPEAAKSSRFLRELFGA